MWLNVHRNSKQTQYFKCLWFGRFELIQDDVKQWVRSISRKLRHEVYFFACSYTPRDITIWFSLFMWVYSCTLGHAKSNFYNFHIWIDIHRKNKVINSHCIVTSVSSFRPACFLYLEKKESTPSDELVKIFWKFLWCSFEVLLKQSSSWSSFSILEEEFDIVILSCYDRVCSGLIMITRLTNIIWSNFSTIFLKVFGYKFSYFIWINEID